MSSLLASTVLLYRKATGQDRGFTVNGEFIGNSEKMPRIEDFVKIVDAWIRERAWFAKHMVFKLQICCGKLTPKLESGDIQIAGFTPEDSDSLEIFLRPKNSDYQYRAHLKCPPGNTSLNLMCVAKPVEMGLILNKRGLSDETNTFPKNAHELIAATLKTTDRKWQFLGKRSVIRKFAAELQNLAPDRQVTPDLISQALTQSGVFVQDQADLEIIIDMFRLRGLIENKLAQEFETTYLLDDYALSWHLSQLEDERKIILEKKTRHQRELATAEAGIARLLNQLEKAKENKRTIEENISLCDQSLDKLHEKEIATLKE